MRHTVVDSWARGVSFLHLRDPRVKLLALLALLVALSSARRHSLRASAFACGIALLATAAARLPLLGVLRRSWITLPFCAVFALVLWLSGDPAGAVTLTARTYVSGLLALLFIATTSLPDILRALEQWKAPRFLLEVIQFLYRYLFLLANEADVTRIAAAGRCGFHGRLGFCAAGGAAAALFARADARAAAIHRAMLSRGFNGLLPARHPASLDRRDLLFLAFALCAASLTVLGGVL